MKKNSLLADEIISLCKDLSLTEEEAGTVTLEGNLMEKGEEKLKLCLFGRFIANKTINGEAFRMTMPKIWRTNQAVEIADLKQNTFAFYFKSKSDMLRIKAGGPWHFDNFLLALETPSRFGEQASMQFNKVDFWVQISNVPLCCQVRETGIFLGEQLGKVLELDEEGLHGNEGGCIRARIRIDISKPLKRFLKIDLTGEGETRLLVLRYERLPDFCYHCGLLGHGERDCATRAPVNVEQTKPYGPWLRASSPQKRPIFRGKKETCPGTSGETGGVGRKEKSEKATVNHPLESITNSPLVNKPPESHQTISTSQGKVETEDKLQGRPTPDEAIRGLTTESKKLHNSQAELEVGGALRQKKYSSSKPGEGKEEEVAYATGMDIEKSSLPVVGPIETSPVRSPEVMVEVDKACKQVCGKQGLEVQEEGHKATMGQDKGLGPTKKSPNMSSKWKRRARQAQVPGLGEIRNEEAGKRVYEGPVIEGKPHQKKQKTESAEELKPVQISAGLALSMAGRKQ